MGTLMVNLDNSFFFAWLPFLRTTVNNAPCDRAGDASLIPGHMQSAAAFEIPSGVLTRGYALVRIHNDSATAYHVSRLEIAVSDATGAFGADPVETVELFPS